MKKLLMILIVIMITFMNFVYAEEENKLFFTSKDDRLYYKAKLLDSDSFMNYSDMIPGKTYKDKLIIKNESKDTDYTLYFKVKEVENTKLANELLDNLDMKIYLDDKLIYNGNIRGESYDIGGTNLKDAIKLGEFKTDEEHNLVVETSLNFEYDNVENTDIATINWEFYGEYNDAIYPLIPDTSDNIMRIVILLFISLVLIAFILGILRYGKKCN